MNNDHRRNQGQNKIRLITLVFNHSDTHSWPYVFWGSASMDSNNCRSKIFQKIPESCQKQNLSLLQAGNYFCSFWQLHCKGFPGGASSKEPTCHCSRCKRLRFDLWVGKTPCRRKWQPTPVLLPGGFHGQLAGYLQSMGLQRVGHD